MGHTPLGKGQLGRPLNSGRLGGLGGVEPSWETKQWEEKHPWERSRSPSHRSWESLKKDRKQWHEDSEKAKPSPALDAKSWLSVAQGTGLTQVKEEPSPEQSSSQPATSEPASSEPASTEPVSEAPKMEAVPLSRARRPS